MAFAPGGKRLAIGTGDGLILLYEIASGERLATFYSDPTGSLAYTPDAFYSGSLTRSKLLSFRLGNRVYPLQQFDLHYDRPDLLTAELAPELQSVIGAYKVVHEKRLKEAKTTDAALSQSDNLPQIVVSAPANTTVIDRQLQLPVIAHGTPSAALKHIEVHVNGIAEPDIDAAAHPDFHSTLNLTLSTGTNDIEITAVDAKGRRSLTEELTIRYNGPKAPTTLYVVAVGVSQYQNQAQNLRFAAKDASDLAAFFRARSIRRGDSAPFDRIVVLDPITDSNATRETIVKVRDSLAKADVDDTVILFFAGHGMLDNKFNFFFAPYDMDFAAPEKSGISIAQMEQVLSSAHSRKRLLLVDACHSGELDVEATSYKSKAAPTQKGARGAEIEEDVTTANAFELLRSMFLDLRENTGTEIISASRGVEVAYESDTVANGIFTRSLLEALKRKAADEDQDGHVSVSELVDFVSDKVEELSGGKQTPTRRQQNVGHDFPIE